MCVLFQVASKTFSKVQLGDGTQLSRRTFCSGMDLPDQEKQYQTGKSMGSLKGRVSFFSGGTCQETQRATVLLFTLSKGGERRELVGEEVMQKAQAFQEWFENSREAIAVSKTLQRSWNTLNCETARDSVSRSNMTAGGTMNPWNGAYCKSYRLRVRKQREFSMFWEVML